MSQIQLPISQEKIVLFTREHWVISLGIIALILGSGILLAIFLSFLFLVLQSRFLELLLILILALTFLILLTYALRQAIIYYYDILVLTHEDLIKIDQEGLLARSIIRIPLKDVSDISVEEKSFLKALVSFGDLILKLEDKTIRLKNLPNPIELAKKIIQTRNELALKSRRIKKMSEKGISSKQAGTLTAFSTSSVTQADINSGSVLSEVDGGGKLINKLAEKIDLKKGLEITIASKEEEKQKGWLQIFLEGTFRPPSKKPLKEPQDKK